MAKPPSIPALMRGSSSDAAATRSSGIIPKTARRGSSVFTTWRSDCENPAASLVRTTYSGSGQEPAASQV